MIFMENLIEKNLTEKYAKGYKDPMEDLEIPSFVVEKGLNVDVTRQYRLVFGGYNEYKSSFFIETEGGLCVKDGYLDYVARVPFEKAGITFDIRNDASVTGRRYLESYICQTPLCYAYEDLLALFSKKIPKVRQRNASRTFLEPLLPEVCAKYLILVALLESDYVQGRKTISLHLQRKSLSVSYSAGIGNVEPKEMMLKKTYFKAFGIDVDGIQDDFDSYAKLHRTKIRQTRSDGLKTLEIAFNARAITFKKYSLLDDRDMPLSKVECDIYQFLKERGGASLGLVAGEFGYKSPRAAKYHIDKLIALNLVQMVGESKSHRCFYRAL